MQVEATVLNNQFYEANNFLVHMKKFSYLRLRNKLNMIFEKNSVFTNEEKNRAWECFLAMLHKYIIKEKQLVILRKEINWLIVVCSGKSGEEWPWSGKLSGT